MATVTNPDSRNAETPTVEHNHVETSFEKLAAVQMAKGLVRVSTPVRRPNLLVRAVDKLVVFNYWLSRPPMTKRDRFYRSSAEADPRRYTLGYDYWRR